MTKRLLFVFSKAPYRANYAQDTLDAVLTAAAFEMPLAVLFMDDGVYNLLPQQTGKDRGIKELGTQLGVLPMYEVKEIFVDDRAIHQRQLDPQSLVLPAVPITASQIRSLFDEADQVLHF